MRFLIRPKSELLLFWSLDPPAQNTPKEKPLYFGNIIDQSLSPSLILQSHSFGTSKAQPLGAFTVVKQKANLIRSLNIGRSRGNKSGMDLIPTIQEWEKTLYLLSRYKNIINHK
jgi:hypothetical protein